MSTIRKKSILSTIVIYLGFFIGAINVYLFTKKGLFTGEEYGLTTAFVAIASIFASLSLWGMPSYLFKFFPFYEDYLKGKKSDMLTWALLVVLAGFLLVVAGGIIFRNQFISIFSNSPEVVTYYEWIFPLGLGLALVILFEAYSWAMKKPVTSSFFKEFFWRILTTILILLFYLGVIKTFDLFIKLYAFTYLLTAIGLIGYFLIKGNIELSLSVSNVTMRLKNKVISFCLFVFSSQVIVVIAAAVDTIVILAVLPDGTKQAGIFSVAQYLATVIQVPQRAILASAIGPLSRAWKDKDMGMIKRVYSRSSINQLIYSFGLFLLILLNYNEAVVSFGLKEEYIYGFSAFIFLGLTRVVDMGTGLNAQIIATSNLWRFELISSSIQLVLMFPLSYLLARQYGILGPSIAGLISIVVYNGIRAYFLWYKFKLQPFSKATIATIIIGLCAATISYYVCKSLTGFTFLILQSILFLCLYAVPVVLLKLSPDVMQVWGTVKKRIGLKG